MTKHNPKNERIKHRYLAYLQEAKRLSPASIDAAAAALAQFEEISGYREFGLFHVEQARRFKRVLAETQNTATGKPLAVATIHSRLLALKAFFFWLAGQPGYKSKITHSDADYFNPSANDSRIATARREGRVPEVEQIRHVLQTLPSETPIEKRDRALIAFALLTGARDAAIASMNVGHVDVHRRTVFQDARSVHTKNRKTFTSSFFPVGQDVEGIVVQWIEHLKAVELFGGDDPLFPATRLTLNEAGSFQADGLERRHWRNAGRIREVFRRSFEAAGLPYFHPHSFRHTLTRMGMRMTGNEEEFKAWSQNLGHEHVRTTLNSYGAIPEYRQAEIMNALQGRKRGTHGAPNEPDPETIKRVLEHLQAKAV